MGPSTEPSGTQNSRSRGDEVQPFIQTNCFLSDKCDLNHLSTPFFDDKSIAQPTEQYFVVDCVERGR